MTNKNTIELQDRDIPNLDISDITELKRLHNTYGKEKVVSWLQAKVALPTRLEAKKLDGNEVNEKAYYHKLADHYIN